MFLAKSHFSLFFQPLKNILKMSGTHYWDEPYLVVPEKVILRSYYYMVRGQLALAGCNVDKKSLAQARKGLPDFGPKENFEQLSYVVAASGQQGVYLVAFFSLEVVARHPVVVFHVTDNRLDRRPALTPQPVPAALFSQPFNPFAQSCQR